MINLWPNGLITLKTHIAVVHCGQAEESMEEDSCHLDRFLSPCLSAGAVGAGK